MSDANKSESGAIPPRATIKLPGQSGEMAVPAEAGAGIKKKTARISLEQASAEPGAVAATPVPGVGVASKTIRLAPAVSGQLPVMPPSLGKALSGSLASEEVKRQTSRIPLEAVLSSGATSAASSIPKTIKVKRPTITPAAVEQTQAISPVAEAVPAAPMAKNQTARVEITPDMIPEPQQTQKKTIKIRRADGGAAEIKAAPRSVAIARAEEALAEATAAAAGQVAKPHVAFVGMAAAALLVLCFLVYVLAAQAYPNLGWAV